MFVLHIAASKKKNQKHPKVPVYPFPLRDPYGFQHIIVLKTKVFSHVRGDASLRLGVKLSGEKHPYYFPWNTGCLIGIPIMGYNKPYKKGQYKTLYNLKQPGTLFSLLNWINATPSISEGQQKMSPRPSTHPLFPWARTHQSGSLHWSTKHTKLGQGPPNYSYSTNPPLTYLPSEIMVFHKAGYFCGSGTLVWGVGPLISHKPRVSKKMKTTMMNTERNANTPISSWSPTFSEGTSF